nr:MAG TPA: hypothetical protein [Caudoviricetes sp.]
MVQWCQPLRNEPNGVPTHLVLGDRYVLYFLLKGVQYGY